MDESQEQLLKRLTLLKQKIRELYPELSAKMAEEHLNQICKLDDQIKKKDGEDSFVPIHKKSA